MELIISSYFPNFCHSIWLQQMALPLGFCPPSRHFIFWDRPRLEPPLWTRLVIRIICMSLPSIYPAADNCKLSLDVTGLFYVIARISNSPYLCSQNRKAEWTWFLLCLWKFPYSSCCGFWIWSATRWRICTVLVQEGHPFGLIHALLRPLSVGSCCCCCCFCCRCHGCRPT